MNRCVSWRTVSDFCIMNYTTYSFLLSTCPRCNPCKSVSSLVSIQHIPLTPLQLYLRNCNIRLARSITTLLNGARLPNKARSLEIPSLFPSKTRCLKYSIDLLKGISLGLNEEIPDSNKLLKTISQLGSLPLQQRHDGKLTSRNV